MPLAAPGVDAFPQHLHGQRAAHHPAQRRGRPQVVVVAAARVEADDETGPDAIGQRLDVGREVGAPALLGGLDQHHAAVVAHALGLERLDGGERGEGRVAVVARAAAEQPVAAAHGRPRPAVLGPADHLRLLVAVAVEQDGLAARARHFHEDDRRAAREAHDVDRQPLDLPAPGPVGDEGHGAVDVAVLRPPGVVHGRLGGDADVLGQGGDDVAVPGSLDEGARAVGVDGHGPNTTRNVDRRRRARRTRALEVRAGGRRSGLPTGILSRGPIACVRPRPAPARSACPCRRTSAVARERCARACSRSPVFRQSSARSRWQRATSGRLPYSLGERKRLPEVPLGRGELRGVRPDGGQTKAVVGDEFPAAFAALASPVEHLFSEASGFPVMPCVGVGLGESRPREYPEERTGIDVQEGLQGALEERKGLAGASRPRGSLAEVDSRHPVVDPVPAVSTLVEAPLEQWAGLVEVSALGVDVSKACPRHGGGVRSPEIFGKLDRRARVGDAFLEVSQLSQRPG